MTLVKRDSIRSSLILETNYCERVNRCVSSRSTELQLTDHIVGIFIATTTLDKESGQAVEIRGISTIDVDPPSSNKSIC